MTRDHWRSSQNKKSRGNLLGRFGFSAVPPNPNEYNVYFARSLPVDLPKPNLPPGFTIHPLQGMDDLEAFQTLYGFAAVNLGHQRELLESYEKHIPIIPSTPTYIQPDT